ncbi:hypothetical protein SBV1_900025 [Verrucomicrobia bacterium]|nr:hypothetical protein SBV1_900025 [Verrucomicrobiota bacterium]
MNDFTQLQDDLCQALLSADALANINIVSYYKLRLQSEIDFSSIWLNPRNGRSGCGILVQMPSFEVHSPNVSGPIGDIVHSLTVIEDPMLNFCPATGTLLSAYQVAQIVLDILHLWSNGGSGQVYAATRAIEEAKNFPGPFALTVKLNQKEARQQTPRCALPILSQAAGLVTLSCVTAGSAIYYTLDGTFPGPSNPGAQKYAAPFPTPTGKPIRYAAWAPGSNGSAVGFLMS